MAQQITLQPPHDENALREYEKGGHFKASAKVIAGVLLLFLLVAFILWLIGMA